MKYKVGDRVKVKSLQWFNENSDDKYNVVLAGGWYFSKPMSILCGKELIIKKISHADNTPYYIMEDNTFIWTDEMIECKVEETKPEDMGEVSDGYHTFNELYEYRMLYNAALFNEFAKQGLYDVHKSRKHSDGEYPFGDSNWFIVMAELPTGQISNHYEMKDWDLFHVPEKEKANVWDGHTPKDVSERLRNFLMNK